MAKSIDKNKPQVSDGAGPGASIDAERIETALLCLRKLSRSLHSTLDIETILDHVVREAIVLLGAESGLVAHCCAEGMASYRYFQNGRLVPSGDWTPGAEIPGRVIVKSESYLTNDALHDQQADIRQAAAYGVRTAVSTPMLNCGGEMIGYLEIHNKKESSGFTRFDLEQLATIAQIAAQAIKNAKAFQKIARDAAELENRVAERTAQLQETNAELDTFAYSVSHDLRAPLRAIQGFAEILLENKDRAHDPERSDFLWRILGAARDMDQMVQDLLAYSRVSRQDILARTVNLDQVVRDAVEQLELAGAGGAFHLETVGPLPKARGNHAVLVQVVLNLLSNSVKYVAPGVTPKLRIWAERADAGVRLFVQDNGIGIAAEDQERIFNAFERLHGVETYKGTGIGLAIARKAVTRLGGRIGVQSRLGEGSRFWIELPSGADDETESR
jgi:signal transduction histidine kinase